MRIFFSVLFFLAGIFVFSQEKKYKDLFEKKADVLEIARKYRFPKYYAEKAEFTYDFTLYNYSDPATVEVNETVKVKLIAAENSVVYKDAIFYDDQSSVEYVKVLNDSKQQIPTEVLYGNYQNDNIFHDDLKLAVYEVNMPSTGTSRTIEYKKKYKDSKYLSRVYFNNEYPAENVVIKVEVPDWLNVEFMKFNFDKLKIDEHTETKKSKDGKTTITVYTFEAKNADKFREEKNAPSTESVYAHMFVIFKSFKADGKTNDLMKDMQGLYNWCNGLCKKVENDSSKLKKIVSELVAGKKTDEEKIESVFYWVQDKIRYIAFEEGIMGYKPMSADKVYAQLYGDCKGMANLLKNMLKLGGFDARLTWIGTRDIPYKELFPTLGIFNHMICCVIVNEKKYFVDGTEDFVALGDYAHRIQGKTVMIEDGEKFITEKIPEFGYERNKQESVVTLKLENGKLKGKKTSVYNGEEKLNLLNGYSSLKSETKEIALKNYLTYSDKNVKISNIVHSDLSERKKPTEISFNIEIENYNYQTEKELFIYLDADKEFENYQFDSIRKNDWEMDHKLFISSTSTFEIPQGYKISSIPKGFTTETEDYKVEMIYKQEANAIVYTKTLIFKNAIIRKNDFKNWNQSAIKMRKVYNTPLVFNKL
ncbi:MAG: transglutaminase family protein [Bacteroidia bacterium]|nr:transglutaminase family protein [Bacteroidia bacterium]